MNETFEFKAIGKISSPYLSKFGIPRQPGLTNSVVSRIRLENTTQNQQAIRGLEEFSHIWVLFIFHSLKRDNWKPLVSPPRFQDSRKIGVFATRSPYRPNPIGQSVVKLEDINIDSKYIKIKITGGDFLEGTPVLDIKPYILYSDAITNADSAWAEPVKPSLKVSFSQAAIKFFDDENMNQLKIPIAETLSYDPRPGYERGNNKVDGHKYYINFENLEIQWKVISEECLVEGIKFFSRS